MINNMQRQRWHSGRRRDKRFCTDGYSDTMALKRRITAELLKYGGVNLRRRIYNLITLIWKNEEMPADWQTAVVCPITKRTINYKANTIQRKVSAECDT
jgi:hypothetical protein